MVKRFPGPRLAPSAPWSPCPMASRQEITWPPLGRPDGRPNGKRMAETGRDGRRSEGRREAAERAAGRRVPLKRRSGFSPKAAPGVLFQVESLGEPP